MQNRPGVPLSPPIQKNLPRGLLRSVFDGKKFFLKTKLFDAVFCADSECHIHFVMKLVNNTENPFKTLIFAAKSIKTIEKS